MPESAIVARWQARGALARPVAYDRAGAMSWRDAVSRSERIAARLLAGERSLGGERVGLWLSPGGDFLACFFAVLRAGGVAVVLSPAHPPPETKYLCGDAGVRRVVASPELAASAAFLAPERSVHASDDLARFTGELSGATPSEEDPALQLYTSGTTGKPKGAVLTHGNLGVQQEILAEAWGLREDDVLLHLLPLHHMHGLCIALLSTVGAGGAARFLSGAPFDGAAAWEAAGHATVLMAVPTIHARLFEAFDAATEDARARWTESARALRLVTSGSAALPVTLGERWRSLTGAYPLERFGMTEIGVGLTNPLAAGGRRPGSVGLPPRTVTTRIAGDDGEDADRGELWIAGPSVFAGYHGRPDETRAAFAERGGERWFRTGDTVERGPDGYVRILGRTSVDILKSGGYKLSALEIEEAMREHPAVGQVAVVGVPDAAWGDRVVACVVPRAGRQGECSEASLRAFLKERLAAYKVPKQVVLMAELPVNALGKVLKPELVRRLSASPA
ncbi:MAG TPA: AMP-binding protein [Polyangiaceae bacterium]|jgi:malonyl-CoA/methylmalonyl-CoA synthetase